MEESILFSVIIPTYNREGLISRAIKSVLLQSYSNFELIIVDDGSTDRTKEVVKSFDDNRIKYVFQTNADRSAARNNGISCAKGSYLCFLDSDDEYKKNHLLTFFDVIQKGSHKPKMYYAMKLTDSKKAKGYNSYEQVLKFMIHSQHVCIHHKILEKEKFRTDLSISEDLELWMRIVHEYELINIDKETLIIYDHDDRSVNVSKNNVYEKSMKVFKELYLNEKWTSKISKDVKKSTISDCYYGVFKYHLYRNEKLQSLINLINSIVINPRKQLKFKLNLLSKLLFNSSKVKDLV